MDKFTITFRQYFSDHEVKTVILANSLAAAELYAQGILSTLPVTEQYSQQHESTVRGEWSFEVDQITNLFN